MINIITRQASQERLSSQTEVGISAALGELEAESFGTDFDATLFNIGTVYFLTDQVSVFANFAQGFSLADIGLVLRNAPSGFSVVSQS